MKRIEKILLCGNVHIPQYDLTIEYTLPADYSANDLTVYIQALEDVEHIGTINWGDSTVENYSSVTSYSHTYNNVLPNQKFKVVITCGITAMKATPSNYESLLFGYITSVKFPDTLQNVGYKAFYNRNLLENVDFRNVENIEGFAFYQSTSLREVKSDKILDVGQSAFENSGVESVYIPNCWRVEGTAFKNCKQLKCIEFEQLQYIYPECFEGCTALEEIRIPSTIKEMGNELYGYYTIFYGCTNLKKIIIDKPEDSIKGAPWGAGAEVIWTG